MLARRIRRTGFLRVVSGKTSINRHNSTYCAIKQVWMTGHFAQLHDNIHKTSFAFLLAGQTCKSVRQAKYLQCIESHTIDSVYVFLENRTIPFALHLRQPNVDVDFLLC